jgi:uncharacterized repeat protein (TIGR03803 family)
MISKASLLAALVLITLLGCYTSAQTETVLYTFTGANNRDGDNPTGNLVADAAGNLYGTTLNGGRVTEVCPSIGCGTVFELSPRSKLGGSWTETTIDILTGGIVGGEPPGSLVLDGKGNLYGAVLGGYFGEGAVGKLSPPPCPGITGARPSSTVFLE